ncbi:MAG: SBBP repeat-containing protein [Planctomycetes bacterium]|nr:SBBP repeat-containing protein [Planctomycetota bacterium]
MDVFLTKINPSGTALTYSTYLGGSSTDEGYDIAVDTAGNAYVTGWTESTNFPTQSPIQGVKGKYYDAFVTKINSSGNALVYSTYFGGNGYDWGYGIAVDTSGNIYLSGETGSTDFSTQNAYDTTCGTDGMCNFDGKYYYADAFVTKINSSGSALVYSTYLGGSNADAGNGGIAIDTSGNAYVTGNTMSTDFPIQSPIQGSFGGSSDAFVTKINSSGSSLVYSTYLGGSNPEECLGIAVDASGDVYVTGETASTDFPIHIPIQGSIGSSLDAFVTKIASSPCVGDGEVKTVETDTGDFELLKLASKVVTVTATDGGGCPVADVKVSAKINAAGKKRIGISPSSKTTDENGKAAFTITAKKKTGKAKVTFKASGVTKQITVTVK